MTAHRVLRDETGSNETCEISMRHAGGHAGHGSERFQRQRLSGSYESFQEFDPRFDGLDALTPVAHKNSIC
jgi:hypothetical protein